MICDGIASWLIPWGNNVKSLDRNRSEALDYAEDHQLFYKRNENGVAVKEAWEYNEYCFPKKMEKFVSGYIVHVSGENSQSTQNC